MPTSVLGGLSKDSTVAAALAPTGIYEVDQVKVGAATAGTITLAFTWAGTAYTTVAIPYNSSAAAVATFVQAATGPQGQALPANSVVATGALSTGVTVLFTGALTGPITGQTITPAGLTGGTATFTRIVNGIAPVLPTSPLIRGSDGNMYTMNGVGTGNNGVALQIYTPTQGSLASTFGSGALSVGFKDVNGKLNAPSLDASGALTLQSAGQAGAPVPAKTMLVGGSDGSDLRPLATDASGRVSTASMGSPGNAAPASVDAIGGIDSGGNLRAVGVTSGGALSTQDASSVPTAPLSINGVAFTAGQSGAPQGPISVGTTSTPILPDSTGVSSINGVAGERNISNFGNVDICVCASTTAIWGGGKILRPGGFLSTTYAGPVSAITQNPPESGGAVVTSPSALLGVEEWA